MKKRIIVFTLTLIFLISAIVTYLYTKNSSKEKIDICFLVGNTKNVRQIDNRVLENEIIYGSEHDSHYSVIVLDGKPNEITKDGTLHIPKRLITDVSQSLIDKWTQEISTCKPKETEIDILKGIKCAAESLDKQADIKKICIYSSGISTTGDLNFAKNPELLYTDPKDIVALLNARKALPDLSDIEVVWYGINYVEEPQGELTDFELYRLKLIWKEILKSCNLSFADNEIFDEKPPYEISEESKIDITQYPNVSVADFSYVCYTLDEFNFEPATAKLKDKAETIKKLKPIAKEIKDVGCPQFYVIGSTASFSTKEECLQLSEERADVIIDILCELGVPRGCLTKYGIGRENIKDFRVNDLNSDGSLNKSQAPKNRKVLITHSESSSGKNFINEYNKYFKKLKNNKIDEQQTCF